MRPALSTVSLNHHALKDALAVAQSTGFRALELLMIPGWVHASPRTMPAEALRRLILDHGLELNGVHGGGIDGTSAAALATSLAYLRELIPYVAAAGARFLNINGMPVPSGTLAAAREEMVERIAEGLIALSPLIERTGISLVLENHFGYQIERLADYQRIFARLQHPAWLGATVDTGHFHAANEDMPRLIRTLGARIAHVHIKDHRHGHSVALGSGEIDNALVVRCLAGIGYQGLLSAELELPDAAQEVTACQQACPYLHELIVQALKNPLTTVATATGAKS